MQNVLTIDDLLQQKTRLSGSAQEALAQRQLTRSKKGTGTVTPFSATEMVRVSDAQAGLRVDEREEDDEGEESLTSQYRRSINAARQKQDEEEGMAEKAQEALALPAKMGTTWLLRAAWLNVIDSFGLTLIYVNIHVLLRWVFGEKFFCKLGDEWGVAQSPFTGIKAAQRGAGLIEIGVLLLVDALAATILLALVSLIVIVVMVATMSWWALAKALWGLGWGGIQSLLSLF